MNSLKYLLVAVVSAAASGTAVYFWMKRKQQIENDAMVNEYIKARNKLKKESAIDVEVTEHKEPAPAKEPEVVVEPVNEESYKTMTREKPKSTIVYDVDEDGVPANALENYIPYNKKSMLGKKSPVPYVIEEEDYYQDKSYECVSLTYYGEDNVLCYDRDDTIISDPESLIGEDGWLACVECCEPAIYVKSDVASRYYQIMCLREDRYA